ncbi:SusD/RagB family nutrient-binding outer membrane lipoprotein [Flagellimonas halotolerans]|uniref:SusD/RagB family nutrient-binding outer membrane lipoprotein n=1 Tax=Flagellimonas halotolerans TaxID=3112164 RepID=A0ABU6IT80_9FLAO|nr:MULTISPECIES: SusD/RagB family nutrient-binding outer membrane lipoprotein [unclassified Allomuricauda]MEC3966298.1 SusD/RagB family nutrient-binding outer membrane lipoprotein [Muricauda sp. SYSU M86414]MEC4266163.1 SusD/RagB family nutrient-binding outer membrane lipoprotein [Muricauda sp. SYSU M84420]
MKKIGKYITVVFLLTGLLNSCETTDLDLRVSPNDLAADQADPGLLLNSIQLAYADNMFDISKLGGELTRLEYMSGRNYFNNYPGSTFDDIWARTYSSDNSFEGVDLGIFTNVQSLEAINAESDVDYSFHIAVGKTLQAHMLMLITDYIGEAAYSEAGDPDQFPAPLLDDGASVYTSALALLDEAESLFATNPGTVGATDFFYDGDTSLWIKAVNSIRLKAYVTTGNTAAFDAVIAENNYIDDVEEDFQWQYGSRELQPDTRHPDYADDYQPSGADLYRPLWLMQYMQNVDDPRLRYYFYRQVAETPGAPGVDPNEETLACSLAVPPLHYQESEWAYCSLPNGYWGRQHGNNEGNPPDGFTKTAVGVYPQAGKFDDSDFGVVGLGLGGGGAGIQPIILSSYVDFWKADNAMAKGESDAVVAELFRSALTKSMAKVRPFAALDPTADLSFEPSETDVTTWIDGIIADFLAATGDDQMNIFADQYFVTLYGGAVEAYNYYRKTGYPTNLAPNWEANPGPFPRTFLYPQNEVITNPNLTQKTDMTGQVFWDTNPASPAFPEAQ